jgi:hypothetical protein
MPRDFVNAFSKKMYWWYLFEIYCYFIDKTTLLPLRDNQARGNPL